ncbi:hypothetical protein PCYB_004240 [Plasmodium cynomolgi strain B]|uniref:CYIR protein n=1 Tax=Plasmodium cynomolgi (strain B) TaxID=1120755 RepID=K6V2Y4_PLACD|nr:hypothetical protein PCYB_004240 [Plasmodium cynomolgi strain B]GAB69675.1 hypothetical protein PCYB_004240 [Plasmodium cynomolgi strain B]
MPLIELQSEIFYDKLKFSNEELNKNTEECKLLHFIDRQDSEIIGICKYLVKYLKTNYKNEIEEHLKDQHCNLLSLWIIEQLIEKFPGDYESDIDNCLRLLYVYPYDNWKKSKDLYEYFVNYDKFNKLDDITDEQCKEYEDYFQNKSPLYDEFDTLYIKAFKDQNNVFYRKCKDYNPKNPIRKLKCEKKISEQEKSNGVSPDTDIIVRTEFSGINPNSTKTFGNVFLGVVATSMISGLLYKVNQILIKHTDCINF